MRQCAPYALCIHGAEGRGIGVENGKVKLVVTDLDDTLLSPEKEISAEAVRMIEELEKSGVRFTFITGRPAYAIERFAGQVKITAPIVSCNGAVIYEHGTGQVLQDIPMETECLMPLLAHAAEMGLTVLVYAGNTEYALTETNWTNVRKNAGRQIPICPVERIRESGSPVYKVNIMADGNEEAFVSLIDRINELRSDYCIALYGNSGCEIVEKSVNKREGLVRLCEECGIAMENVLAVGDNANDQEMLRAAGVGAVVANGTKETTACADYVCAAPYTDGFVEAVRKFVQGGSSLKLATSTNIYFERRDGAMIPVKETLRQCAAAGFRYLDFGFAELSLVSERFHTDDWQQEIQEYIEDAGKLGLEFVQAHATIFDFCNAGEDYEKKEELFMRSIRGAAMMKVPWLVVHPSSHIAEGIIQPDTHEKNVAFFKKYAAAAAKEGVGLAVENMWGRTKTGQKPYCLEPEELLRLIEDVDCGNVKICWDVEHGSIEKLNQKKALHMLKEHIVATHISDEAGEESIHILPYLGHADWDEILGTLAGINYTGVLDLEIQHYLPGVPEELVPSAMRLACETGMQMIRRIEKSRGKV